MTATLSRVAAAAIISVSAATVTLTTALATSAAVRHNHWTTMAPVPVENPFGPFNDFVQPAAGGGGLIYYVYPNKAQLWAFSPTLNTWRQKAPPPANVGNDPVAVFAVSTNTLYVLAGSEGQGGAFYAYSVATNAWTVEPSYPHPRSWPAAAIGPDKRLYLFGGSVGGSQYQPSEVFDPTTMIWTKVAPMLTPDAFLHAAKGPDGKLYVIGGCCNSNGSENQAQRYNVYTNTWEMLAPAPFNSAEFCAVRGGDGRIYTLSTTPSGGKVAMAAYSTVSGTWSLVAPLPHALSFESCASLPGNYFYSIGGGLAGGGYGATYRYSI